MWEKLSAITTRGGPRGLHGVSSTNSITLAYDTEPYEQRSPKIWVGADGPRMLEITGRYADGWWPGSVYAPEEYAAKLRAVRGIRRALGT